MEYTRMESGIYQNRKWHIPKWKVAYHSIPKWKVAYTKWHIPEWKVAYAKWKVAYTRVENGIYQSGILQIYV
jgi:hypothetical protein